MDLPSPTSARPFKNAMRALFRALRESADSMTLSQLSATRHRLSKTLKVFEKKQGDRIAATLAENQTVLLDLSDYEDSDDDNNGDVATAGEPMESDDGTEAPLPIPGPYPITPPEGAETADGYYVVDHGREVGIFVDEILSTQAIADVPDGHRVKLNAWCDAANLYNALLEQGLIVRV